MIESKITQKVKESVVKAYHAGEDVVIAIGNVTKEVVKTAKDEDLNTKEKVQTLAKDALEGAKEGYEKFRPPTEDFVKKASKSIVEAIKANAPKVASFSKDVFDGLVDGAKEVIDESKKKEEEKEEEKKE